MVLVVGRLRDGVDPDDDPLLTVGTDRRLDAAVLAQLLMARLAGFRNER